MQHDDLDREQARCASPISAYCQHHCDFSRAARTAWPARIEECRRLREQVAVMKREKASMERERAYLLNLIASLRRGDAND